ncbi:MAG: type 4a pilus biogenesis protein PilO [Proteobacteria bacterium]|nr:type 4a pilus biogenesis protein PilO [Pseudomonadota bacterium]
MEKPKLNLPIVQIVDKIGQLSRVQRIAIMVVTFLLVAGAFVYLSFIPKSKEIATLQQDLDNVEMELTLARTKASKLPELRVQAKKVEIEFKRASVSLPTGKEIPRLLQDISASGREAGLEFNLFQPNPEIPKQFYAEIPISIKVVGDYHQIATFFDKVSRMNRIVNIKDLTISPDRAGGGWRLLIASCTAMTYRFVEAQAAPKDGAQAPKKT